MKHKLLLAILSSLIIFSCKTVEPTATKSSQKEVTALTLTGITNATSTFDQATNTYTFTVSNGTNVKALAFTFTLPTGATSIPTSGSTQDFTNPVTYTVTAEDGSKQSIKVVIVVQAAPKSSEKKILTFSFNSLNPIVTATIDEVNKKITATVPANTDLTTLIPTITFSAKSTLSPNTGVAQNFTNSVNYTITAEDGNKQAYSVTIIKNSSSNSSDCTTLTNDNYLTINSDTKKYYLSQLCYVVTGTLKYIHVFTFKGPTNNLLYLSIESDKKDIPIGDYSRSGAWGGFYDPNTLNNADDYGQISVNGASIFKLTKDVNGLYKFDFYLQTNSAGVNYSITGVIFGQIK
jgi:Domain of unknown function (DUF5018)